MTHDTTPSPGFKSPATRSPHSKAYWEGLQNGELVLQQCGDCAAYTHPPGPLCTACLSANRLYPALSGRGTLYTYTVIHRALHPEFKKDLPYVSVYVRLDEGPMLTSWLVDVDPANVKIGAAVEAVFEKIDERTTLHRFRPLTEAEST